MERERNAARQGFLPVVFFFRHCLPMPVANTIKEQMCSDDDRYRELSNSVWMTDMMVKPGESLKCEK